MAVKDDRPGRLRDGERPRRGTESDDAPTRRPAPRSNGLTTAALILGVMLLLTIGGTALPGLICSATAPCPSRLGFKHRDGFNAVFVDGSVRFVRSGAAGQALRAGIEPNDGRTFTE